MAETPMFWCKLCGRAQAHVVSRDLHDKAPCKNCGKNSWSSSYVWLVTAADEAFMRQVQNYKPREEEDGA
jgi:hypothetical protein